MVDFRWGQKQLYLTPLFPPGMVFAVLAASPLEIRDPESREVLDTIDREKVRVKISEIRDNVTVCRTYRTRRTAGIPGFYEYIVQTSREIPETLALKDSSLPPPLSEEDSYVKVNDRVYQVRDE